MKPAEMKPADRIPLEAIAEKRALNVPKKLSRETATRLMKRGWIRWLQHEETRWWRRGTVELTDAGRVALAGQIRAELSPWNAI